MSWRANLLARLIGNSALASATGNRISWFEAARSWKAYPQLLLQEITPGREYTHSGPDGLDGPTVQFDIYAESGNQIEVIEAALLAVMEAGPVDQAGTRFHPGFLQGRRMMEPTDLGNNRRILRMTMDFTFFHESV